MPDIVNNGSRPRHTDKLESMDNDAPDKLVIMDNGALGKPDLIDYTECL